MSGSSVRSRWARLARSVDTAAWAGLLTWPLCSAATSRALSDARNRERSSNWKSAQPLNSSACAVLVTVEAFDDAAAAMSLTEP